jgi:hypothetical protein
MFYKYRISGTAEKISIGCLILLHLLKYLDNYDASSTLCQSMVTNPHCSQDERQRLIATLMTQWNLFYRTFSCRN